MPPKRKLPANVIEDFRQWIEMGAPDPRKTTFAEVKSTVSDEDIERARETFWSYQPVARHPTPDVDLESWPKTDIDRFVLGKLEQADLEPAEDESGHRVLRRLSFDLIGLPPSLAEIEAFSEAYASDPDAAVAQVVDRYLGSEQFGERWGRHWLDVARYAESTGHGVNLTYTQAWRYRDYVIDSFNEDKPYDQFVQEQIAGDLLPADTDEQWAENLVATSFLELGPKNVNEDVPAKFDADVIDEQIDTTTRVFLGQSLACARCHDHKFDAIRQEDYYALAGIFSNAENFWGRPQSQEFGSFTGPQVKRASSLLILPVEDPNPFDKRYTASELQQLKDQMQSNQQQFRSAAIASRTQAGVPTQLYAALNRLESTSTKLGWVDENGNPYTFCMGVQDKPKAENTRLLVRGEIDQPGQMVERGFPAVLDESRTSIDAESSGRLELAHWIGSSRNPLTARVMVNRIWKHLLGRGIVSSTEDFGVTGAPPTHPELLDYLAGRFIDSGWSVKSLVRDIATSRIYRSSSAFDADAQEIDPNNTLLWRIAPKRLDSEVLRDAMLAVSGEIDLDRPRASFVAKAGHGRITPDGVSVFSGNRNRRNGRRGGMMGRGARQQDGEGRTRRDFEKSDAGLLDMVDAKYRSVYLPIVRQYEPRSLKVFDFPDPGLVTGTRETSATAHQALYMMNNPFVIGRSQSLAEKLLQDSNSNEQRNRSLFLMTYAREPSTAEMSAINEFLGSEPTITTWQSVCQSLLASAEFRYAF